MFVQLRLWERAYPWTPKVDLVAKLHAEHAAGRRVDYHFCGRPLTMQSRNGFRPGVV